MSQPDMEFCVGYSPTGAASCKVCRGFINKNVFRIGVCAAHSDISGISWYHYKCFWSKCLYRNQLRGYDPDNPTIENFDEIKPEDQERFKKKLRDFIETINRDERTGNTKRKTKQPYDDDPIYVPEKKKMKQWTMSTPKQTNVQPNINNHMYQISEVPLRYVSVSKYQSTILVGIREYYLQRFVLKPSKTGRTVAKPSKTGISLNVDQWNMLKEHMDDVDRDLETPDMSTTDDTTGSETENDCRRLKLSENRFVVVIKKDGQPMVDIREFIVEDKNYRPGEKGLCLTVKQWNTLKGHQDKIDRDVGEIKTEVKESTQSLT